ncbi:MAG: Carbohydrate acetyl esterase/feruloyl esterase precursor [Bacteroidetes bacterium ADurb.Bin174]|nr:MAG: Carbohydrate acetyl esterase/feruloyl esterase precursor [Bacteroidetes bacterium ADurb.Bin174]
MKKKLHSFVITLCLILITGNIQTQNLVSHQDASENQRLLVVLLAGQSNMAGRGIYSELAPADTVTYANILSLNRDSVWVRARHPLHWDKSAAAVGMGISFAKRLADYIGGDVAIGLVPCAAGGTNIDRWINDEKPSDIPYYLYSNLISRGKKAAQSGDIIGMIWHQGEANAGDDPAVYQGKMETLFTKIRTDLNLSDMIIVAGELGHYLATNSNYGEQKLANVNSAIHGVNNVLTNYGVAKATGLTANSDNLHFTANSQVEFGKRYADVFYSIYNTSAASLTSLELSEGMLSPAFNPDITEYTCYLPQGITSIIPSVTSYVGGSVDGAEAIDVSSGSGSFTITVTAVDGITNKIYTIHYKTSNNVDYTNLIINNDFDLAPDAGNCSESIPVAPGIDGWDNNAWRPRLSTCKQFYGWTFDVNFNDLGNNSQGINADATNKHGNYVAWIGGSTKLPNEIQEFYQTIDGLPAGTYKIQCLLGVDHSKITTQRLFANNNVQYHGNENQYISNQIATEIRTFANHSTGANNLKEMEVYTTIADGDSLKLGIRTGNKRSDGSIAGNASALYGWFKTDYFRLTKIDPEIAGNADLAGITLSSGDLNFSPEVTSYEVALPEGTETVTASAFAFFQEVKVAGAGAVDVSLGSGQSDITVTAIDGVTTKTYTIHYIVGSHSGIDKVEKKIAYWVSNGNLTLTGVNSYAVFNLNGMKVAEMTADSEGKSVKLAPGFYIVKTKGAEAIKIVVR